MFTAEADPSSIPCAETLPGLNPDVQFKSAYRHSYDTTVAIALQV